MANIELPKDAEGREIPLDTKVLYDSDGIEFFTDKSMYMRLTDEWWFFGHFGSSISMHRVAATRLHLTPPDSLKKLEEDLGKIVGNTAKVVVCSYFGREAKDCEGCKFEYCDCACSHAFLKDVMERIHKLRGEA